MYLKYIHTILQERERREKEKHEDDVVRFNTSKTTIRHRYRKWQTSSRPSIRGGRRRRRRETKIPKLTSKVNQNTSKRERERERRHTPTVNKKKLFKRKHIENLEVIDRLYE